MLNELKYKEIFLGLISDNYDKPFECVGTKEEINYALKLSIEKYTYLPELLKFYKDNFYDKNKEYFIEDYFNNENFINEKFLKMMGYDNFEK